MATKEGGRFLPVLGIFGIWLRIKLNNAGQPEKNIMYYVCFIYEMGVFVNDMKKMRPKAKYFCTGLNEERRLAEK